MDSVIEQYGKAGAERYFELQEKLNSRYCDFRINCSEAFACLVDVFAIK